MFSIQAVRLFHTVRYNTTGNTPPAECPLFFIIEKPLNRHQLPRHRRAVHFY